MYIEKEITANELVQRYSNGEKLFKEIAVFENETFESIDLSGSKFENCFFHTITFRNVNLNGAAFNNCNLKCSDFLSSDLSNVIIENCAVEATSFKDCNTNGLRFNNNHYCGLILGQDDFADILKRS